jgi:phosphoenolpyruvate-protein kinase (PTS system EI component)
MLPMVTVPAELEAARTLLDEAMTSLARDRVAAVCPKLGIMIEVPAAAIAVDQFDADFFSIGSNDLTQYVTAAGRDIGAVADLADPLNPAIMRLIASVARHGRESGSAHCSAPACARCRSRLDPSPWSSKRSPALTCVRRRHERRRPGRHGR